MGDLISREDTLAALRQFYCPPCDSRNGIMCRTCYMFDALNVVEDMPAVDAEPVRRGEWIKRPTKITGRLWAACSACGALSPKHSGYYNFCPNCGAKMEDKKTEGEGIS